MHKVTIQFLEHATVISSLGDKSNGSMQEPDNFHLYCSEKTQLKFSVVQVSLECQQNIVNQ